MVARRVLSLEGCDSSQAGDFPFVIANRSVAFAAKRWRIAGCLFSPLRSIFQTELRRHVA